MNFGVFDTQHDPAANQLEQGNQSDTKRVTIPIHTATISQMVSYTRSPLTGSVFGSDDQRAKNEIVNLVGEIFERIV